MAAQTVKERGNYVLTVKEIIIESADDVAKLPTSTTYGSFEAGNSVNEPIGVGSFAYTGDLTLIYQLGLDNTWKAV